MPRPAGTIKATYVGILPQGEQFQTGFWIDASGTGVTLPELQALANNMAAHFIANSTGMRNLTTSTTLYDELRLYYYAAAGPAPATAIAVADISLTGNGGSSGSLPLQSALVVSLRTALVGRRYRGRMYWPMNATTLSDHQASQAQIDLLATDAKAMLDNVNGYDVDQFDAVVMSAVGSTRTLITRVEVDSRLDVQRRRAESQTELRQAGQPLAA
jgi:hypothetical protein